MQGFLRVVALLCLLSVLKVAHGQDDICKGFVCPRGRMCVLHTDESGDNYTTCECPTSCPAEVVEPVCSYYNTPFNSRCEMHQYGCAHDLTMRVKSQGSCPSDNKHVCTDFHILQFPSRYLEWIMIAQRHSIDPAYDLNFSARADALTENERKEVLSWEFDYIDKNKNDVLEKDEIDRVFKDVLEFEPCIYGFLQSCDQNRREGIERREWDYCFPVTSGTAFETRK